MTVADTLALSVQMPEMMALMFKPAAASRAPNNDNADTLTESIESFLAAAAAMPMK